MKHENRLAQEASPYLRQHATNPVDWFPWGEEAIARAKERDVPILLSIGYSACHWCHVMERESFEDEAIAAKMNELFVSVKVDREERPDLDQIYQLVVQIMGRSGGWPLTVFLTPDQRPFFGGTYFPPTDRYGVPGFTKILDAVAGAYRERRDEVTLQAGELTQAIAEVTNERKSTSGVPLDGTLLRRTADRLSARFDDRHGGFGSRPKFPNTMALDVLLRRAALEGDARAESRVRLTLDAMRAGGIYDQLGGGFHRYSTDEKWLVPHFEKMLYDNALLLRSYADGFRALGEEAHAATVRDIAAYLAREMRDPGGAFYATQDADSEGEEGKFFVWDEAEIRAALDGESEEAMRTVLAHFGVRSEGNFEETKKTVLAVEKTVPMLAVQLGLAPSTILATLERTKARLLEARRARVAPFRDEKILASWNGLLVASLADAGALLDAPELVEMARGAFAFVEARLTVREADGARLRVLRLAKDGAVKGPGFLDDHAFFAWAALALYEATGEPRYVQTARSAADAILAHFVDDATPGFFFTPDDGEALIHRAKDAFDNAIPSGQAIATRVLLHLGTLVDASYGERARRELEHLAPLALDNPFGFAETVGALDRLVRGSVDVVLVGGRSDTRTCALAREVFRAYLPNRTLAWVDPEDDASRAACALLAEGKEAKDTPVAYVCRGRTCSLPVAEASALAELLRAPTAEG